MLFSRPKSAWVACIILSFNVWLILKFHLGADQAVLSESVQGGAPKAAEPSVADERREANYDELLRFFFF